MTFHAFCSWIAALVVLPMVLLVPVERALPISLFAVGAWSAVDVAAVAVLAPALAQPRRLARRHAHRAVLVLGAARPDSGGRASP
jgi:hypothetical protein